MRKISLLLFLCVGVLAAHADSVSRQEAQQVASRFFATRGKLLTATNVSTYSLIGNATQEYAPYYVFNADGGDGFVIVSGNSLTEEIIGYGDTGTFDEATLNDNVRSWMQAYADEINWIADNESALKAARATAVQTYATPVRHAMAPLLTCLWGQGDPYNALLPTYTSSSGGMSVSATGCTATALAQVTYFHKFPAATVGEIPAMDAYALPAIPAGTTFDWDNMLDSYEGDYTDEQVQAVAELNLCVAQAIKTTFSSSSSSSFNNNGKEMFEDYFGFDKGVLVARNTYYTIDEWSDMVYSDLEEGYPVPVSGYSTSGGHAFVVDGYDGEGFFHVNWGWEGLCNGYFRLTVLQSSDDSCTDLMSSGKGFTRNQDAVLYLRHNGVIPATATECELYIALQSTPVTGSSIRANFRNITGTDNTYECGLVMRNDEGEYVSVGDIVTIELTSGNPSGYRTFSVAGAFSAPGEYKLSLAYRLVGMETWIPQWTLDDDGDNYILAEVDDDLNVNLTLHELVPDVTATNWEYLGYLEVNQEQNVIITLANAGAEYGDVVNLYAYRPGDEEMGSLRSRAYVGVKSGSESKVELSFTPDAVGEWILCVDDGTYTFGTDTIEIVSSEDAKIASLAVTNISISNDCYGSRLTGTATLKNNGEEDFNGQIMIYLWTPSPGGASSPSSTTLTVDALAPGRTTSLAFNFGGLNIGQSYSISVRDKATGKDIEDGGALDWSMPYVLKAGILQWSNDGTISGSAAKDALTPTTSVAGIFCEGASPATLTPSRNTNTIYAFTAGAPVSEGLDGYNVVYDGTAEQITFANNGYAAYLPLTFTAHEAVYRHTFATASDGVTGWEALVLPFKPDGVRCEGADIAWKRGADDEDGVFYLREFAYEDDSQTVVFDDVEDISSLWANAPYVIAATEEMAGKTVEFYAADAVFSAADDTKYIASTDDYRFCGTTLRVRDSGLYILNSEGDAYEYTPGTASVSPFANYFVTTLPDDQRPETIVIASTPTGIRAVESTATPSDGACYDLQGRRITDPTKGVYIRNGKKYVK